MSLMSKMAFTSRRERNLWLWALVAIVGIYATLGLARTWSGVLRNRGILDDTFMVGFGMILLAIVLFAFKKRAGVLEIGIGLGITAVYLMLFLRMAIPEERSHLIEYSVVALLVHAALLERRENGRDVPALPLQAIGLTTLVGFVDELIQLFLPNRVFDWIDVSFNFIAACLAVVGISLILWARRRTGL